MSSKADYHQNRRISHAPPWTSTLSVTDILVLLLKSAIKTYKFVYQNIFISMFFQAMKVVNDRVSRQATEKQMKERELSKIKINKDDVDLIVS